MPRQLFAALALAAWLAAPASAGQILYATAAVANRIDGFCVNANGGLDLTPLRQQPTVENPRRVIVAGDVLYVAGSSRVEAFKIDDAGRLRSLGRTPVVDGSNPRDIVVDPARRMLYMPQREQNRIVTYPLDAEGGFASEDFTSCARGATSSGWENMVLVDDRLYATSDSGTGRILVYRVAADGTLPEDPTQIDDASPGMVSRCSRVSTIETEPISERRCLAGAGPLLVDGDVLYVAARVRRRILSFDLASDGLFTPAVPIGTGGCRKLEEQHASSRTRRASRYLDMVRQDDTIFASVFEAGRVHAFPLVERDGLAIDLPKRAGRKTSGSFVRNPGRLAAAVSTGGQPTLYVSGGQLGRIEAFRLTASKRGLVMETKPFSRTEEQRRSFPNDVVVTTVATACGG
jgi:hypothetical protein